MGKTVAEIMKDINKDAGEEILTIGLNNYDYDRIPFTSTRMNYCTFGGIPVGKVIEFHGEEHGGKTTTALDIVANYQNMKDARKVLYVDAENRLDAEWARKLGVDVDSIYLLQPKSQSAEAIFQMICDLVDTGEIGLWVLDSIGSLLSKDELDKDMDEATYAGVAKPLTRFGKRIEMLNARHRCTGIGINQERAVINGSPYGPSTTTPGGKGWRHFCSVRLKFRKGKYIDEKRNELTNSAETPAGNIVLMSMEKNSTCPPTRRTGFYTINYDFGIDYLNDLVDVALKYGIIDKHGSWFTIIDTESGEVLKDKLQGKQNVIDALDNDIELQEKVENLVDSCLK